LAEPGVVLQKVGEIVQQIEHDPQHGKRVETVQQRHREFPQQVFIDDAHVLRLGNAGNRGEEIHSKAA
jgi:hypothetical protein